MREDMSKEAVKEYSVDAVTRAWGIFAGELPKLPHFHSPCSPSSETMGKVHVFKGEVATRRSSRTARLI